MKNNIYQVGSTVLAIKNVGLVQDGQPGIITNIIENNYCIFWKKQVYFCTFFGGVKVAMMANEISGFEHGHSLEELEFDQHDSLSPSEQMRRIRPLKG